ncbi:MAG: response regulator transcription factor [Pseudomonadota bacterium]
MRALVVEDDAEIALQLREALERHGYAVDMTGDGEHAWFLGDTEHYDVVVLDIGLPGKDGLSVLNEWRSNNNAIPVLILTARDTWREKVTGLRSGADDYLTKPFEMEEMLARVEVLTRRAAGHASSILSCGDLSLDPSRQQVTEAGKSLDLSALEYRLIAYLIHHKQTVVSKSTLNEHLYEQGFDRDSNVIEVLVNRCRNKLSGNQIKTLRGRGYILEEE